MIISGKISACLMLSQILQPHAIIQGVVLNPSFILVVTESILSSIEHKIYLVFYQAKNWI